MAHSHAANEKNKIQSLLNAGKAKKALSVGLKACKKHAHNADLRFLLAVAYSKLQQLDNAEQACRESLGIDSRHRLALENLANLLRIQGRYAEAAPLFQTLSQIEPHTLMWSHEYAKALAQAGDLLQAVNVLQAATKNPQSSAELYNDLGCFLQSLQQQDAAEQALRQALSINPKLSVAHDNLGSLLEGKGDFNGAERHYSYAIQTDANNLIAYENIANMFESKKNIQASIQAWQALLSRQPQHFQAHKKLGDLHQKSGDVDRVVQHYQAALRLQPNNGRLWNNLGNVLANIGKNNEAVSAFQYALKYNPEEGGVHTNYGNMLHKAGRYEEAIATFRTAIELESNNGSMHNNLANTLRHIGKTDEAIEHYLVAQRLNSDDADSYSNLGNAYREQGKFDAAIKAYRQALVIKPEFTEAHSNLVFFLNNHSHLSKAAVFQEHQAWERQHGGDAKYLSQEYSWRYDATQAESQHNHQRLRIAYVSADFYKHSVAYFLLPLLRHHASTNVSVTCYMNGHTQDSMTETLQAHSDHWRVIMGQSAANVAALIRQDQIDVLIDLSGHTAGNRLDVFTLKPAPLQITWLGYPNTTGLSAMDYRLTDIWADPVGEECWHSEKLIRLDKGFLCYSPPPETPEISPTPALSKGYITYGSFNNLAKHDDRVIALWSQLLKTNKKNRLLIKNNALHDPEIALKLKRRFAQHGIVTQLELMSSTPSQLEHLALYQRIDIALDTFPYNGTTTTCEALWMGVPVIALAGDRHAGRVGVSLLNQIGHPEWVADNENEYIHKAQLLGDDFQALNALRQKLRPCLQKSSLNDAAGFAKKFEAALIRCVKTQA